MPATIKQALNATQKWWLHLLAPRRSEHNAAPLNTFAKEDCVNVRHPPPPISGTSDRRSLNADRMGIKHRDHGPSSSLANSMTSHHGRRDWLPHAKRPLNCSWLTLKSHRSQKDTICQYLLFFVHAHNVCCPCVYLLNEEAGRAILLQNINADLPELVWLHRTIAHDEEFITDSLYNYVLINPQRASTAHQLTIKLVIISWEWRS